MKNFHPVKRNKVKVLCHDLTLSLAFQKQLKRQKKEGNISEHIKQRVLCKKN